MQTCQNQLKFIHTKEQYVMTKEKQTWMIWYFQLIQMFSAIILCIWHLHEKMLRLFSYKLYFNMPEELLCLNLSIKIKSGLDPGLLDSRTSIIWIRSTRETQSIESFSRSEASEL